VVEVHSNPYDFTKPISDSKLLAGRNEEIEKIKYYLDQAVSDSPKFYSFALVGKRATGKSSLLNVTKQLAKEKDLLAIKVSLNKEIVSNHDLFYEELIDGILTEGYDRGMYRGLRGRFMRWIRSMGGSAEVGLDLPYFKMHLSGSKKSKGEEVSQQVLLRALNRSLTEARKQGLKGIVVLLDECNLLADDEILLQKIRNVVQDTVGFTFVFAGTDKMFSALNEVLSPASRSFIRIEINDFDSFEKTRDCILLPLTDEERKKVSPHCIPEIHGFTGGSPYEITLVAHYMYKKFRDNNSDRIQITVEVLDDVLGEIERLRKEGHHDVASKIKSLWPVHLKALLALLEFGESNISSLAKYMLLEGLETLTPKRAKDRFEIHGQSIRSLLDAGIITLNEGERLTFEGDQFDILYLKYHSLTHGFDNFFVGDRTGSILNLQQKIRTMLMLGIQQIEHVVRFDGTHGIGSIEQGRELILTGAKVVVKGQVNIPIDPERLYHDSDTTFHFRINVSFLKSGWVSTYIFNSKEDMTIAKSRLESLRGKLALVDIDVILDDEVTLNNQGLKLILEKNYSDAVECFAKATSINPKSERAFYGKALALFFLERYDESIENCDLSLELFPNWAAPLELKGKCFFHKLDYDNALMFFDKALNENPEYWDALDNKARALLNIGQFEEAASCFEIVTQNVSGRIPTMKLYARALWGLKANEKAISVLDDILDLHQDDKDALVNKYQILIDMGQYDNAISVLEKAIEVYPKDPLLIGLLSVPYIKKGDYEKGLEFCERALSLNSDDSNAWYNKACALSMLGRKKLSISALKRAVELMDSAREVARKDSDFDPIRESTEFKRIIRKEE
jgi:tetratricopeptide (TPR) repeat protein